MRRRSTPLPEVRPPNPDLRLNCRLWLILREQTDAVAALWACSGQLDLLLALRRGFLTWRWTIAMVASTSFLNKFIQLFRIDFHLENNSLIRFKIDDQQLHVSTEILSVDVCPLTRVAVPALYQGLPA